MRRLALLVLLIGLMGDTLCKAASLDGVEILRLSDEKLVPAFCSYTLTIETVADDGKRSLNEMDGFKKGPAKNVLVVKQPKRVAGSAHIRKDDIIWSYYTTNHKLNKVAYQSLFMGSLLSYGDVLATELSYDYDVTSVVEKGSDYVLTLQPKKGHQGYAKVIVTIGVGDFAAKRREFYALSGVLMKTSEFKNARYENGRLISLEQEFYEPLKNRKSTARFEGIKTLREADIPEKYYNENYVKFLSGE